jgi:hypothetical protein
VPEGSALFVTSATRKFNYAFWSVLTEKKACLKHLLEPTLEAELLGSQFSYEEMHQKLRSPERVSWERLMSAYIETAIPIVYAEWCQ